jgi:glycosyltransferase involved in cell wall biosynthesis
MERNKIKVLYIGPIPPEVGGRFHGGVATHLWELATQASKRGYDVHILAEDAIMPTSKLIIRNIGNVKIIIPPTYKLVKVLKAIRFSLVALQLKLDARFLQFFDFKEMLFILYLADVLREVIDTIKPNLIHVHSLLSSFNLALRIVNPPIPIITTDHGAYWEVRKQRKGLLKLGLALSIPSLRKVICVSKHVKEKLLRFHTILSKYFPTLISPDNIVVIHNPIDNY